MIPFNRLGLFFRLFASWVYPREAISDLSGVLEGTAPEGLVLDVGAGTGILTRFANKYRSDLKYVALDPALGMLRHAPPFVRRVSARGESLPFRKGIFSAVLVGDAIHHFSDPGKAILEIKNCMIPGGRLFIFDMNPDTFVGSIIFTMERLAGEPALFRPPQELAEMLTAFGFRTKVNRYDWRYSVEATPAAAP
jgi:SAM-dependent methyltransferase